MKMMFRCMVFAAMVLLNVSGVFAADVAVTMDEAKLKEFILQVIKDNPKVIMDTVNEYVRDQQKVKETQEFEESLKKRANDTAGENVPIKGNEKAQITVIEYSDFQCPYCAKGAESMKELLGRYPDKVKIAFKNNPLNFHNMAMPAAKAALAAHKQGKFWEYHDLLFQNSAKLSEELFSKFAQDLKLDMTKFDADRKSEEIAKQIEAEMNKAKELGLNGTPSFLVNGVIVRGTKGLDYFAKIIDKLLTESDKK